jgi:hypothetical protein
MSSSTIKKTKLSNNGEAGFNDLAFASNKLLPVHRWVPWIAGFSSDFVSNALGRYLKGQSTVLDPFSGVGTTLVEAIEHGHDAIGFEINPYAALTCRIKAKAHLLGLASKVGANRIKCTVS